MILSNLGLLEFLLNISKSSLQNAKFPMGHSQIQHPPNMVENYMSINAHVLFGEE